MEKRLDLLLVIMEFPTQFEDLAPVSIGFRPRSHYDVFKSHRFHLAENVAKYVRPH